MDDARFCPECGAPHVADAHFCTACGHPFAADGAAAPPDQGAAAPPPPSAPPVATGPAAPVPPPPGQGFAGAPPPTGAPAPMGLPPQMGVPAGGPPPPYVAPVPGAPSDGGKNRALLLVLGGLGLLLLVAGGAFLLLRGGDGDDEGELFLEPVAFVGEDPFTESVDVHNAATTATTSPVIDTTAPAREVSTAPTHSISGAWPGLYGGTRDATSCDPDQLVAFLQANPAKARAWAGVIGIRVADIETYVDDLTPVILQRDTRVTNHGFRDGRATATQSVLQAGTAVMVDEFGIPRVKCNCGNPLDEPQAVSSRPSYQGERWPTFSPANVVRVTVDVEVSVFVLVDVKGGEPINRPTGTVGDEDTEVTMDDLCDLYPEDPTCSTPDEGTEGEPELGTGDVQVTLRWGSTADLDLAVTDPTGAQVNFENRSSPSGGALDVDSNADCATATSSPVENVFWPTGSAPDGAYTVSVTYYNVCGAATGPQSYQLTFKVAGTDVALTPASLRSGDDGSTVATYELEVGTGRPSLLGPAGATVQTIDKTIDPGAEQSFQATKAPGINQTEPEPEPEPDPAPEPGDEGTAPAPDPYDCSQYEEGTPMRVLCEHVPGSAVSDGASSNPAPAPAPGD